MTKVYGRVSISGDKFDEYLQLRKEEEEKKEPFRQLLLRLNEEFEDHLSRKLSPRTVKKHKNIVNLFIDFICRDTDVASTDEITCGVVNTHFKKWWKRKVLDSTTPDQLNTTLKKFFKFLASEKNIVNENALKGLQ